MSSPSLWFALVHVLGWMLLHFLWEGTLVGLVYALLRPLTARGPARYRLGIGMLYAFVMCSLLTLWGLLALTPPRLVGVGGSMTTAAASKVFQAENVRGIFAGFDVLLPWLVLAWSLGVMLLSARAWGEWRQLKAMVLIAAPLPSWQHAVVDLAQRFRLRRHVGVLCSQAVSTPVLIGWIRPVILLPLAVVTGFPTSQIELILAHELAHLRRSDPLANLFQVVVETLHFYHPAVRWISREVRNEREICCDRLALTLGGGSHREFVSVLAELGELRGLSDSYAAGGQWRHRLLDRAQQLMPLRLPGNHAAQRRSSSQLVASLLGVLLMVVILQLQWTRTQLHLGGVCIHTVIEGLAPMAGGFIHALTRPDAMVAPAMALLLGLVSLPRPLSWRANDLHQAPSAAVAMSLSRVPAAAVVMPPAPLRVRQPVCPQAALSQGIEG